MKFSVLESLETENLYFKYTFVASILSWEKKNFQMQSRRSTLGLHVIKHSNALLMHSVKNL